ncbi:MAG: hypothetical protein A2623_03370 [Caulobacterales bacterium RIFCSPHIGHO2_01_FULL_70_19]|nr:MAG: hypothetical protein A2623_03370 [Caulobacterales bacterium RIFCSPHIGHO2_01_FULL_70_19]
MVKLGFSAVVTAAVMLSAPAPVMAQSTGDALPAPHPRDRLIPAAAPASLSDWKRKPVWHLLAACDVYFRMHAAQDDFFGDDSDSGRRLGRANDMLNASRDRLMADRGLSGDAASALHAQAFRYFNHDEDLYGEVEPVVERRCRDGLAVGARRP